MDHGAVPLSLALFEDEGCNPFTANPWIELGHRPVTRDEVAAAIEAGDLFDPVLEPYPGFSYGVGDDWTRRQHVGRIAWFAVHGWKDPIFIDVGCPNLGAPRTWPLVTDGHHRLAAAFYRKDQTITASLAGQVDLIEEIVQESAAALKAALRRVR